MKALFLEDVEIGRRIVLGSYRFTRQNMLAYARQFDPVGFHVDDEAGKASVYGALTAAGLHAASAWMQCYVAANALARQQAAEQGQRLPEIGPSPGFRDMKWLKPIFVDDVVQFSTTATAVRPLASRKGWGMVTAHNEGVNQNGELVFSFESAVLTQARPA